MSNVSVLSRVFYEKNDTIGHTLHNAIEGMFYIPGLSKFYTVKKIDVKGEQIALDNYVAGKKDYLLAALKIAFFVITLGIGFVLCAAALWINRQFHTFVKMKTLDLPEDLLIDVFKMSGNSNIRMVNKHFSQEYFKAEWNLFCDLLKKPCYDPLRKLWIPNKELDDDFEKYLKSDGSSRESFEKKSKHKIWTAFTECVEDISIDKTEIPVKSVDKTNLKTIFDDLLTHYCISLYRLGEAVNKQISSQDLQKLLEIREHKEDWSWEGLRKRSTEEIDLLQQWFKENDKALHQIQEINVFSLVFLPPEIGYLKGLKRLSIYSFLLISLPLEMRYLMALEQVDLALPRKGLNSLRPLMGSNKLTIFRKVELENRGVRFVVHPVL